MINKNTLFKCLLCPEHSTTLHEVYFGKHRRNAVKYNVQVPICNTCHRKAHGTFMANWDISQDQYKTMFLDWLGLDKEKTEADLEKHRDRAYLEEHKNDCLKMIMSLDINNLMV